MNLMSRRTAAISLSAIMAASALAACSSSDSAQSSASQEASTVSAAQSSGPVIDTTVISGDLASTDNGDGTTTYSRAGVSVTAPSGGTPSESQSDVSWMMYVSPSDDLQVALVLVPLSDQVSVDSYTKSLASVNGTKASDASVSGATHAKKVVGSDGTVTMVADNGTVFAVVSVTSASGDAATVDSIVQSVSFEG